MQIQNNVLDVPATVMMADGAEFEFFEPKRVVVSPLELCLLSNEEELFDDD